MEAAEASSARTDYGSRRTGDGLLDTGSTPVWSIEKRMLENTEVFGIFFISVFRFRPSSHMIR